MEALASCWHMAALATSTRDTGSIVLRLRSLAPAREGAQCHYNATQVLAVAPKLLE